MSADNERPPIGEEATPAPLPPLPELAGQYEEDARRIYPERERILRDRITQLAEVVALVNARADAALSDHRHGKYVDLRRALLNIAGMTDLYVTPLRRLSARAALASDNPHSTADTAGKEATSDEQ